MLTPCISIGTLRGKFEAIDGQTMYLREKLSGRLVPCVTDGSFVATPNSAPLDKWVLIEGRLSRDRGDGNPISMDAVREVSVYPEVAVGSWRDALGCSPNTSGLTSAELVRRVRDNW